jgi:hypothetical protein
MGLRILGKNGDTIQDREIQNPLNPDPALLHAHNSDFLQEPEV